MNVKKILVTGANGFIGKVLSRRLIKLGHEVFGLARSQAGAVAGFKKFFSQDITQSFALKEDFDFVFHLAAHNVTHVGEQARKIYNQVNVKGTRNVIKAVNTRHFVFLSTAKVYCEQGKPIRENSPLLPLYDYEKSKLAAEIICAKEISPKKLIIFRPVNIVGKGQAEKGVIPVFLKKAKAGETLEVLGSCFAVLQYLYVEDAVDAFLKVIEDDKISGIYNLSSGRISLGELAFTIKDICQAKSEIRFINSVPIKFSEVLSSKIEKALGWKAKTTINKILEEYR